MRKSRRLQGLSPIMPLIYSPTTSAAASSGNSSQGNENDNLDENLEPLGALQPHDEQEQVTPNINKRFEDMQELIANQSRMIQSMQSLFESSVLHTQNSITALNDGLRGIESNMTRLGNNVSEMIFASSSNPRSAIPIVTSAPSIENTTVMTSQPILPLCISSTLNLNTTCESVFSVSQPVLCTSTHTSSIYTVPRMSAFATSQPIAHESSSCLQPLQPSTSQVIQNPLFLHRQKKMYPLPKFSGLPEEWLTFYETFITSTEEFEYSELHNIMRLRDCLEGNARESVESLLTSSRNVNAIIETLSQMYGRPEQLIKSQIHKVRSLPSVSESDLNSLITFANKVSNMTTFLESVGGSYHLANPLLLSELLSKLPLSRRLQWADKSLTLGRIPTIADFSHWLHDLRKVINMVTDALPLPNEIQSKGKYMCVAVEAKKCRMCNNECKSLAACNAFLNLSFDSRWQKVKLFKVCFSCLKFGHHSNNCYSKKKCEINGCQFFHHNLLHKNNLPQNSNVLSEITNSSQSQARNCLVDVQSQSVLFQIIPVLVYGPKGSRKIYAFIDDGANVSMIDSEIAKSLGISGPKDVLELKWIYQQTAQEQTEIVDVEISGLENSQKRFNMKNVYISSNLDLPQQSFQVSEFEGYDEYLHFGTLHSYPQVEPKMIISLSHAYLTVPVEIPRMSSSGLIITKTRLGCLVYGGKNNNHRHPVSCHFRKSNQSKIDDNLEVLMKSYFGMETFGIRHYDPIISADNQRALDILTETTKRKGERFESGLLWRNDFKTFPDSYNMASKRLNIVERKMSSDPEYAKEYCNKIEEYLEKGYARILSEEEALRRSNKTFYLPHFGVKNPNKKKLRFVFDAAAETNNISLNKALLPGPDLNQPLLKVLFKFRQAPIAVCGDLKEMFHQVNIIPEDQDALRFLWRNGNTSQSPKTYVMQRMIFGAACSPTTAQFVKNRNAEDFINDYPRAVAGIIEKHYVDDYVDCFDSEKEAIEVVNAVKRIHKAGGFEMHNFLTNSKVVAEELGITNEDKTNAFDDNIERILGMHWVPNSDLFIFALKFHKVPKEVMELKSIPTKRQLLSVTMSIFDPFGFVADFMIAIKILMQDVWRSGIEWDSQLPEEIYEKFKSWLQELPMIAQFKIPRFYFKNCDVISIELHLFCDASEEALASVAYWRIVNNSGSNVVFVTGKTACAPIRFHSIPKLELQAAVMAARLKDTIFKCHDRVNVRKIVFWSDSHTVIRWIRSDHRKYKQYVANRVSEILENSEMSEWRWCPTLHNPADIATRAKFPVNYDPEGRWKKGPDFLLCGEEEWPDESSMGNREDKSQEFKKSKHFVNVIQQVNVVESIVNRSSKFMKLVRVMAWIKRFCNNVQLQQQKQIKIKGELSMEEIRDAENKIVEDLQKRYFSNEYERLLSKGKIDLSSDLRTLNPYIDDMGLVRVGGRLDNANVLSEYAKRPIILPKCHRFSRLLVEFYHIKNCHQNTANVIGDIREKYWIPSIRKLVRSVESQCVVCKIRKAKPVQPQMGTLPVDRVTPFVRPFTYTGVDIFGPFNVSIRRRHEKRWVVLFTCMTVRAIHLEVVSDLSTDSFLLSLRNFVNRRGVPVQIRSDNGRNFVGIDKELRNEFYFMDYNEIMRTSSPLGIKWIFNTPLDPSSGGVWERLIQSVKKSLSVLLGNITPKLDVFTSFLIECENIVNSRPLTHIPVTPFEPEPITPNHFLLGNVNSTQTPSNFDPKLNCLRKQWRILQNLKNGFWIRWIKEYLPDLTRRVKWCLPTSSLQVGSLVLICDEIAPRSKWRRGRVVGVYTGKDGISRAADVKTCDGLFKRPISKLAVLDVSDL